MSKSKKWHHKLLDVLAKPFQWVRTVYRDAKSWMAQPNLERKGFLNKIRSTVRNHPFISLTGLFVATVGLSVLSGIWWLGGTLFVLSMILFSGTSFTTGLMRTGSSAFELVLAVIMLFMVSAVMAPVADMWLLYILAPIALVVFKVLHDMLAFSTFMVEAPDILGLDMSEEKEVVHV